MCGDCNLSGKFSECCNSQGIVVFWNIVFEPFCVLRINQVISFFQTLSKKKFLFKGEATKSSSQCPDAPLIITMVICITFDRHTGSKWSSPKVKI